MRSRIVVSLVTSTTLLTLSACASIVEGSTDRVSILTNPPSSASCTLSNSRGSYSTLGSGTASVKKSKSDLNVTCLDPQTGAKGQSTVVSDVEAWAFGNILIGGLIGLGVDWGTGAAYDYPDSATVPMVTPVASTPFAPASMPFAPQASSPAFQPLPPVNAAPSTSFVPATPVVVPAAPVVSAPAVAAPSTVAPAPNFSAPSGY